MKRKLAQSIFLMLLFFSSAYAFTTEESKIAMMEKELQFMKEGYKYIEPTPQQKKSGVISIYEKVTCSPGVKCGLVDITDDDLKKKAISQWSNGKILAPNGTARRGEWFKLSSHFNIAMQNETASYVCIRYDMNLVDDRTNASNYAARNGCMTAYSAYHAEHELYLAMNYPASGKYTNTTTLNIFDYPSGHALARGLVFVN